ncbi:hypothetical protein DPX16_1459 [Anabarilius grahami]|uniref:Uncharacterized protein n=1 Tax=Anabarilius grahami TaxID=495550 RepID=A0A3N0YKN4_ANAGA|nr:hypothetical protein DPX16_1459 [Anabarilius grahami]
MVVYDNTMGLENLFQKTIRVARRYSACALHTPTANPLPATPSVALPAPEQMQVDSYRLTRAERQRRIQQHLMSSLPVPSDHHAQRSLLPEPLYISSILTSVISASKLSRKNRWAMVTFGISPTLMLCISCLHTEEITFMVLEGSTADIILRRPWLVQHQPDIQWNTAMIISPIQWSINQCISQANRSEPAPPGGPEGLLY